MNPKAATAATSAIQQLGGWARCPTDFRELQSALAIEAAKRERLLFVAQDETVEPGLREKPRLCPSVL